jgi:hypothetical protein
LEDAETDLREMKVKILQQKAINKEEWASVVKKAKQGSQSAVEPRSE